MKTKSLLFALLLFPFLLAAQINTEMPDVDKHVRTDYVKSTMGMVQVLDSSITFSYNGSDWDSSMKKCIHSRHWGTHGLPNEWYFSKYNDLENRWDLFYYEHYTYFSDTAEDVDEYVVKPYNQYIMNWDNDTIQYYNYLGYNSQQFGPMAEKVIFMNYDFSTYTFMSGAMYDIKIKDDTLYDYYDLKSYNSATGLWEIAARISLTYDANNYQQKQLFQQWSPSDNAFVNYSQSFFVYQNGLRMQIVSQEWSGSAWENNTKTIYEYSPSGKITLECEIHWDDINSEWVNYSQNLYTFTGGLETEHLNQIWNTTTDTWDNSARWVSTYDVNSNLLTQRKDVWNGSTWDYSNRYTYTYNSNNQETAYIYEIWDIVSSAWENVDRKMYTYDGNYNLTSYVSQQWDDVASAWENIEKYDYTYDTNNNMTLEIYSMWNSGTTSWDFNSKTEYYYSGFDANSLSDLTSGTVNAFPNPTNGFITISPKDRQYERITITDFSGRIIMDGPMNETGLFINLKQYGAGIYSINLTDHSGKINSTKVVVQ